MAADSDLQGDPSALQGDDPPAQVVAPAASSYSPPAVIGEISVQADWTDPDNPPILSGFALPTIIRLRVSATTEAGGTLDPAGIPIQFAVSGSARPVSAGLIWLDAVYDGATRLAAVEIPDTTVSGNYFGVWRSVLAENAPNQEAGLLSGLLRIE